MIDLERLEDLRVGKGWLQAELARRAGLSRAYISLVEQGAREPSAPALKAIAKALGVEPVELLAKRHVECPNCGHLVQL